MTSIAAGATDRKLEIQGKELSIDGIWNTGKVASLINSQEFEPEIKATTESSLFFTGLPNFSGQITLRLVAGEDYSKARAVSFAWDGSPNAALNAMDAINREASVTGVRAEKYVLAQLGTDSAVHIDSGGAPVAGVCGRATVLSCPG